MLKIFSLIASMVGGGGIKSISADIRKVTEARISAKTDKERLAAEERMNGLMHIVESQTRGAGATPAKIMRMMFALPVVLINAKLFVWDKLLGWGTTDQLSPYMHYVCYTVIGFYFLDNSIRMMKR